MCSCQSEFSCMSRFVVGDEGDGMRLQGFVSQCCVCRSGVFLPKRVLFLNFAVIESWNLAWHACVVLEHALTHADKWWISRINSNTSQRINPPTAWYESFVTHAHTHTHSGFSSGHKLGSLSTILRQIDSESHESAVLQSHTPVSIRGPHVLGFFQNTCSFHGL